MIDSALRSLAGRTPQLAQAARAEQRAQATHLKRALKGSVIALAILALLFFLASHLSAAPNFGRSELALLDLSKSVTPESFRQTWLAYQT